MRAKTLDFLLALGWGAEVAEHGAFWTTIAMVAILCVVGTFVAQKVVLKLVARIISSNKLRWDDKLLSNRVFHRLSYLLTPIIISMFTQEFPAQAHLLNRLLSAYSILVILFVLDAFIHAVEEIYAGFAIAKIRPIKGLLQVAKIVMLIIGGIIFIATLSGQSPMVLLGGISALTAVLMLVFQNAILGFVAGIQLTSNDMIRIGDWIEVPKHGANGSVLEISLCTVKVQNFDKTITSIPAYALTSDSFCNWRGMQEGGGRRIMRSLNLDINSVQFCTEEMLEKFSHIQYLKDYMKNRQTEIDSYNLSMGLSASDPVGGRRMTNIGVFRAYISAYLRNHPGINQQMTLMVRQLEPQEKGVALQIYAFANTTQWEVYEGTQADIFDHLLAIAPVFGLRVFQSPSGFDLKSLSSSLPLQ